MITKEIFIFLMIHLIVPLVGFLYFIYLTRKIKRGKIVNPPIFELFIIFATYGGLLLVILTTLFWFWSGMASLGAFYLILGAPIIMGIIAYRNKKTKSYSKYHLLTYKAGLLYFVIAPLAFLLSILISKK